MLGLDEWTVAYQGEVLRCPGDATGRHRFVRFGLEGDVSGSALGSLASKRYESESCWLVNLAVSSDTLLYIYIYTYIHLYGDGDGAPFHHVA